MPADALDLSLNEVETLAQKAARGAGLPWGVAEDTGHAAGWLARRVGDWAESLLGLLEAPPPSSENPLLLAGLVADSAASGVPLALARVAVPLWAVPGALLAASRPLTIALGIAEIACMPGATSAATLPLAALDMRPASLALHYPGTAPALPHPLPVRFHRSIVPRPLWQRLDALAHRTYVPASDRSRRTGAGAGLLDDE